MPCTPSSRAGPQAIGNCEPSTIDHSPSPIYHSLIMEYGLSLGTNIEDRLENLCDARKRISELVDSVIAQSHIYETEPVDVADEYKSLSFLNAVLVVESMKPPHELAAAFHTIETEMGRIRGVDRNAPRPIDIDIIYAGNLCVQNDILTIPHARWSERRFVVQPLSDVRPDLVLPNETCTVNEVLLALRDCAEVICFEEAW